MTDLERTYSERYGAILLPLAERLEQHLKECLTSEVRVDRITARAKSISRFIAKANKIENEVRKYQNPLTQIQDQIGARIITYYQSDIPRIAANIRRYLHPIENKQIIPDTESEFGYIGEHFVMLIPSDVLIDLKVPEDSQEFVFELQIKTLFQHAWAEAEHDIGYKPITPLTNLHRRKLAFTAAQAWGADQIFEELYKELGDSR